MCGIGVEMMMGAMVMYTACMTISLIDVYNLPIVFSLHGAVVLFRSREHENCGPQPGYVRAHIESKLISSLLVIAFEG